MTSNDARRASMPLQAPRGDRYSTSSESRHDDRYDPRSQAGPSARPFASPPYRDRDQRPAASSGEAQDTRSWAARKFDRFESERRESDSYKRPRYDESGSREGSYPRNSQHEPYSSSRQAMSSYASDRYDRHRSHTHAHAGPPSTSPLSPAQPTYRNGAASSHSRAAASTGLPSATNDIVGKKDAALPGSQSARPTSSLTTGSVPTAQTMSADSKEYKFVALMDELYDKKKVAQKAEKMYVYVEKFKNNPAPDDFRKTVEEKRKAVDVAKQEVSKIKTKCAEVLQSLQVRQVEPKKTNEATQATSSAGSGVHFPNKDTNTPPQTPSLVEADASLRLVDATKAAMHDQIGKVPLDEATVMAEVQKALSVAISNMRAGMNREKSQQTAPDEEPPHSKQDTLSEDVQQLRLLVERQQEELKEYKAAISSATERLAEQERMQAELRAHKDVMEAQSQQIIDQQTMIASLESAFDRRAQIDREVMGVLANHAVALSRHERYVQETAAIMEQVPRTNTAQSKPSTPLPRSK